MRPWTEAVFSIPAQQLVASRINTKLEIQDDKAVLVRPLELDFVDDKEGKHVAINLHIGLRLIAAFGNSDGDLQMLQYATSGAGVRFGLIVHHTDAQREWAYDRESSTGKLDKALDAAPANSWTIVDMKQDWKLIYAHQKR